MELIKINNDGGKQTVNARELHKFLGIGKDFSTWIKNRVKQYDFVLGQDFALTFTKTGERKNVTARDYHISLDMAKELSMVERNEEGKKARKYFIECERKSQEIISTDPIIAMRQKQIQLESRLDAVEIAVEAKQIGTSKPRELRKDKPPIGYENKGDVATNVAKITQTTKAIVYAVLEAYSADITKKIYIVECIDEAGSVIETAPTCYFILDVINAVKHAVKNSAKKTECFRVFKTLNNKSMKLKVK